MKSASAASSSPDGRDLVYSSVTPAGGSIRVRHQDGSELEVAPRGFWPRWSPDGRRIAYTTSDSEGGDGTIHAVRPDGSEHRELTLIHSQVYRLCWTPDSSRVIFASEQSGPTMLWSVEVESGIQRSITRGPGECGSPSMAPDGRSRVFEFSHRRWYVFLSADAGATVNRVLMEPGMRAVAPSPDGARIAVAVGADAQSPDGRFLARSGGRRPDNELEDLYLEWLDSGTSGFPLLLFPSRFTGELYVLEPPAN